MDSKYSIVEFIGGDTNSCGYCKSSNTNLSDGMWAYTLKVEDYQDLVDKGWRRSGHYVYKSVVERTCCPLYTIRCEALNLKLSKSQKKVLKTVGKYLSKGIVPKAKEECIYDMGAKVEMNVSESLNQRFNEYFARNSNESNMMEIDVTVCKEEEEARTPSTGNNKVEEPGTTSTDKVEELRTTSTDKVEELRTTSTDKVEELRTTGTDKNKEDEPTKIETDKNNQLPEEVLDKKPSTPKSGVGQDFSKPQCKKAKLLRLEKKQKKMLEKGLCVDPVLKKKQPSENSLEDYINESLSENVLNKLELKTVRSFPQSQEYQATFTEEFEVYQKYQIAVHNDSIAKITKRQFERFLVKSPLKIRQVPSNINEESIKESWHLYRKYQMAVHNDTEDDCKYSTFNSFLVRTPLKYQKRVRGISSCVDTGYGSFHQQYWLNGKLIAVGVIDILPNCVSSVYFFYDPDYSFLSLGTYGSLREMALVRSLNKQSPELKYYYLGYYIHSCPKMRYKARFSPSSLRCPEVNTWHPIADCQAKLDKSKYSRFNEDIDAVCEESDVNMNELLILYNHVVIRYSSYKRSVINFAEEDEDKIKRYAQLVGRCAERMVLLR